MPASNNACDAINKIADEFAQMDTTWKGCHWALHILVGKHVWNIHIALLGVGLGLNVEDRTVIDAPARVGAGFHGLAEGLLIPAGDEIAVVPIP